MAVLNRMDWYDLARTTTWTPGYVTEDELFPPASLMKLMTAEYVFNELKTGKISENTEYKVSEYAWRTGGALRSHGCSTIHAHQTTHPSRRRGLRRHLDHHVGAAGAELSRLDQGPHQRQVVNAVG